MRQWLGQLTLINPQNASTMSGQDSASVSGISCLRSPLPGSPLPPPLPVPPHYQVTDISELMIIRWWRVHWWPGSEQRWSWAQWIIVPGLGVGVVTILLRTPATILIIVSHPRPKGPASTQSQVSVYKLISPESVSTINWYKSSWSLWEWFTGLDCDQIWLFLLVTITV